jgi:hypothetical protein
MLGCWGLEICPAAQKNQSPIISLGKDGHLVYERDERGNRVPDFSSCGYAGGDRQVPSAPVRVVVAPGPGGNSTIKIQRAIDYVGSLQPDSNGLRGAVLLLKGRHEVIGALRITNSGVVLRGQGISEEGTRLVAVGLDRRTLIRIEGKNDRTKDSGASWQIKDDYVPVGATGFHLDHISKLKAGDTVCVIRPCTTKWIEQLRMTEFGGGEGDWRLTWKPGSRELIWHRVIKSVDGDFVALDAPITTALEKELFGGGRIEAYSWPGRIANVGVENMRLETTFNSTNLKDENHSWCAITMENAADSWVRQVTFEHFAGSAVALYESCRRVTVEDCLSLAPISEDGGYRRHTFFTMGQQTLFLRCCAEHGRHDFAAGQCASGPNAFVQCEATGALGDSGAIESWASGTLFDNVHIDGNGLTLGNREASAQGAGWSAANCVLWNCSASKITCARPPTAQNWAFGCWGEFEGDGVWRNSNGFMRPESLYVAQMADRLGSEAGSRVKLLSRSTKESTNPTVEDAATIVAASRRPPPQLADFLLAASQRNPIADEPGSAKRVENLPETDHSLPIGRNEITITNGWLACNGKLLVGGISEVAWWRGNVLPSEAASFGIALTRFVPGRSGSGFTDDLDEVADTLQASNRVALDHHYGLWYDRRRDDHERIRRMTGDTWPPFYEQPFARSGLGASWDGLSKYDLTKFNPWYWSRLRKFADVCDARGLVLFHEDYFQHNILEAGAHWADCPWRSANNINDAGFPEPPPYAGDKRIFMAEQFYDVTHPARRALHRAYIRQCLENFTANSNVIQFTSAEFTGPKHFAEFWLDTVAEWERETGRKALVALSCTKDVQDALLADSSHNPIIDVIDFRYWWLTDKGLFAPPGGKNLAPRQFERQWRGGRPTDLNLARMATEYRPRYPAKILINNFGQGAWAWLCAGGSLPNLPRTTETQLLAAIPGMQPWQANPDQKLWILREPGKQLLVFTDGASEIDLSTETGTFVLSGIDARTGRVKSSSESLRGGGLVKLPVRNGAAEIFWLTKQ